MKSEQSARGKRLTTSSMTLDKYLEAIKSIQDDRLTTDFGVYDNFPVLVQTNPNEFMRDLVSSKKYRPHNTYEFDGETSWDLEFIPRAVTLDIHADRIYTVIDGIAPFSPKEVDFSKLPIGKEEEFRTQIVLHPSIPQFRKDMNPEEAMGKNNLWLLNLVSVIEDIRDYVSQRGILTCLFPYQYSPDGLIVYHKPGERK